MGLGGEEEGGGKGEHRGNGREMTQTLYARMNKRKSFSGILSQQRKV
jgi:hypothetical protein